MTQEREPVVTPEVAAAPQEAAPAGRPGRPPHKVEGGRVSTLNIALAAGVVLLVFLLIFILQNLQDARIHYLGATGRFPLGVGLLLAALAGAFVVLVPMGVRILQLRRVARHHRKEDERGGH